MSQKKNFDPALLNKLLREIAVGQKKNCSVCGKEALPHWKFCPNDGEILKP
ncbi:MAG: hypothetical protein PHW04_05005 [Candidatus Wallbacteria bacterium]|nr:hypothetical protein [Candidatus Wallbacteria bacterium]